MKKPRGETIIPARPVSPGAQAILLNVLEELAERDDDPELARQVRKRRDAEKAGIPVAED